MNCYECEKGNLKKQFVEYKQYDISLGKFEAEVCNNCSEVFYSSASVEKIEKESKAKGLFGLGAKTKIGTSGNALDIKIPKSLVTFLNVKKGQEARIEPIDKKRFQVIIQ